LDKFESVWAKIKILHLQKQTISYGYGLAYTRASAEKFQGGEPTEKTRPKNRTIKPPSTLFVSCMKNEIHGDGAMASPYSSVADVPGHTYP